MTFENLLINSNQTARRAAAADEAVSLENTGLAGEYKFIINPSSW